jgi:hypothetical protein
MSFPWTIRRKQVRQTRSPIGKLLKLASLLARFWRLRRVLAARRRQVLPLVGAAAAGAGVEYLFDPERGGHRRRVIREKTTRAFRHSSRRVARQSRATVERVIGRSRGALHAMSWKQSREPLDDAGLAHKVESVLFRDPKIPKGDISINAENGTVFLRGQIASAELIDDVMESVRTIAGVEKAVNLLHLPGTPAPHPAAGDS